MKSWQYSLIKSLLAMLGFASCDPKTLLEEPKMYGPGPAVEYGQPYIGYSFKSRVHNKDGQGIKGVRVVVASEGLENQYSRKDTLYTDAEGRADMGLKEVFSTMNMDQVEVKFEDIDGEENGAYDSLIMNKEDLLVEKIGDGDGRWRWADYQITAEAELPDHQETQK